MKTLGSLELLKEAMSNCAKFANLLLHDPNSFVCCGIYIFEFFRTLN